MFAWAAALSGGAMATRRGIEGTTHFGPDVYDASTNPLHRDVLAHYSVVALPCRVREPDREGKVESGIGRTQKTPLRGMRFDTLPAAQVNLDPWESC